MTRRFLTTGMAALAMLAGGTPAMAQDKPALALELNAVQPSDKGCRLTFVVNNGLGAPLARAGFEVALFDATGIVDRITVLEFKDLPAGRTKVSRFELADVDCSKVGRVLVNAVTKCEGDGIDPAICEKQLTTTSKAGIQFGL